VLQLNVRSLGPQSKRDELQLRLQQTGATIAALQETWLAPDQDFSLPGWKVVCRDDRGSSRAGGVMILARTDVRCDALDMPPHPHDPVTAVCAATLNIDDKVACVIVNAYQRPRDPVCSPTTLWPTHATAPILLVGDFNAHHPRWDVHSAEDVRGQVLSDWFDTHGLVPQNDGEPTWFGSHGAKSAPDISAVSACDRRVYIDYPLLLPLKAPRAPRGGCTY